MLTSISKHNKTNNYLLHNHMLQIPKYYGEYID